jgi:enediyne biosynthesis protein E4
VEAVVGALFTEQARWWRGLRQVKVSLKGPQVSADELNHGLGAASPGGSLFWSAAALVLCACTAARGAESPIVLRDVTARTGIQFSHHDGSGGAYRIVEYVCAGLALFDFDQDGSIDIYFLNGAPADDSGTDPPPKDRLYRNDGAWRFTDVTEKAGLANFRHGLGVTAADYDNDGFQDLYVNNYGANILYRNNGDGTFTEVTDLAGVENGERVGAAVCFLDTDGNGQLDLFVSNYVIFTEDQHSLTTLRGISAYPSPLAFEPDSNTLYRSNGDGTFTDVSMQSGIGLHAGTGMGAVCADYDNDGDTDIIVCNDMLGNFVFENDGTGQFTEVALYQGVAFDITGRAQGSMGVDCGDYDNDGWLDFIMTSYQDEIPVLYRNSGQGYFDDVSRLTGAGTTALRPVTWGVGFVDFDNDSHRDIFVATGHLEDNVALKDDTVHYETPNVLLHNTADGRFRDISSRSGDGMQLRRSSRGAGFDDLDDDGRVDVVILNSRREPTILRNESPGDHHWIQIRLVGTTANRDAVGSQVKVVAGELEQIAEVHSGRGYQSHFGTRLHFGLGAYSSVDRIEVQWLGGDREVFEGVQVNRQVTLIEGSGTSK